MAEHFTHVESESPGPGTVMVLGALAGVVLGYLYFTEHGRRAMRRAERVLASVALGLARLSNAAHVLATISIDELDAIEARMAEFSRSVLNR